MHGMLDGLHQTIAARDKRIKEDEEEIFELKTQLVQAQERMENQEMMTEDYLVHCQMRGQARDQFKTRCEAVQADLEQHQAWLEEAEDKNHDLKQQIEDMQNEVKPEYVEGEAQTTIGADYFNQPRRQSQAMEDRQKSHHT